MAAWIEVPVTATVKALEAMIVESANSGIVAGFCLASLFCLGVGMIWGALGAWRSLDLTKPDDGPRGGIIFSIGVTGAFVAMIAIDMMIQLITGSPLFGVT